MPSKPKPKISERHLVNCLFRHISQSEMIFSVVNTRVKSGDIYMGREIGTSAYKADLWIERIAPDRMRLSKSIAIEVKIRDWQGGLYQAWRYNSVAQASYLAIYEPFAKNVDLSEFKAANVGLIVFTEDSMSIKLKPKQNRTQDKHLLKEVKDRIGLLLNAGENFQPVFQESFA